MKKVKSQWCVRLRVPGQENKFVVMDSVIIEDDSNKRAPFIYINSNTDLTEALPPRTTLVRFSSIMEAKICEEEIVRSISREIGRGELIWVER